MQNNVDLFDMEIALEDAENLLNIFAEFCEDEGMRTCTAQEDEMLTAVCFMRRVPRFYPILKYATEIIQNQRIAVRKGGATQ